MATRLSRRDFVKGITAAGAVTAVGALAGCSKTSGAATTQKWDQSTDVIVVGAGFAALASAITAAMAGANTLVIEKAPEKYAGGNSRVCGQLLFAPADVTKASTYFKALSVGHFSDGTTTSFMSQIPDEMVTAFATALSTNLDFVQNTVGVKYKSFPYPEYPTAEAGDVGKETYIPNEGIGGSRLWTPMTAFAKAKGVKFLYETPATKLVKDSSGQVTGVIATSGGKDVAIQAKKAVIMCCGGFENNPVILNNYAPTPTWPAGTPYNTGDGIKMCQEVGADMWHFNMAPPTVYFGILNHGLAADFKGLPLQTTAANITNNMIWLDKYGKRFINEARSQQHGLGTIALQWEDSVKLEYPRLPVWVVFDQTRAAAGIVGGSSGWTAVMSGYAQSAGLVDEVSKGLILKGNTIEELASKMKLDPAALKATVDRYNGFVAAKVDADFGRPAASLTPVATGPFYAASLVPQMVNTDGGPRRNAKGQIVDLDGNPIPRLYSAGEFGSIWNHHYQGGGNVGECLAFGRISGANAAKETSL